MITNEPDLWFFHTTLSEQDSRIMTPASVHLNNNLCLSFPQYSHPNRTIRSDKWPKYIKHPQAEALGHFFIHTQGYNSTTARGAVHQSPRAIYKYVTNIQGCTKQEYETVNYDDTVKFLTIKMVATALFLCVVCT